ncbi:hypothetical protein BKA93DRAFT_822719 [Sparassis latifolia]
MFNVLTGGLQDIAYCLNADTPLVDTGSSNTWVGAEKAFVTSSSAYNTGKKVAVTYGSGSFSGAEYEEVIGPLDLTPSQGTIRKSSAVNPKYWESYPSTLSRSPLSPPRSSESVTNAELTFGGTVAAKYTGPIAYISLSDIYLVVNDIGTSSGEGLDFINGYAFLERLYKWFYSAFDTGNNRVGFAATSYTDATTN